MYQLWYMNINGSYIWHSPCVLRTWGAWVYKEERDAFEVSCEPAVEEGGCYKVCRGDTKRKVRSLEIRTCCHAVNLRVSDFVEDFSIDKYLRMACRCQVYKISWKILIRFRWIWQELFSESIGKFPTPSYFIWRTQF